MIINANALSIPLADKCVHTVVTSPPYYGLRDYGTAKWIGGNSECDHKPDIKPRDERPRNNLTGGLDYMKAKDPVYRDICGKCGAIRQDSQLGLEPTPDEYVANLVQVFREVWRVLRDDGVVFLNLGDSYFSSGQRGQSYDSCGISKPDCQGRDYLLKSLCDVRKDADRFRNSDIPHYHAPKQVRELCLKTLEYMGELIDRFPNVDSFYQKQNEQFLTSTLDHLRSQDLAGERLLSFLESTPDVSFQQPQDRYLLLGSLWVFLSGLRSLIGDVQECVHKLGDFQAPTADSLNNIYAVFLSDFHNGYKYMVYACYSVFESYQHYTTPSQLKVKDLIGIPWMLAFALRADGWYLRQDIIWAKPNPMPESVKDRCTKSHEYIFLLSKSAKYYYDNEAIMEVATGYDGRKDTRFKGSVKNYDGVMPGGKPQTFAQNGHERWQYKNLQPDGQQPHTMHLNRLEGEEYLSPVRNKRDVWFVSTKPYKGAHYATFNPELITPCILAGAPETCCAECGAPYKRVTTVVGKQVTESMRIAGCNDAGEYNGHATKDFESAKAQNASDTKRRILESMSQVKDYSFEPTCSCNAGTTSGIVFDPFVGSGTTVATAIQLGRRGVGLDLSMKYLLENAKERIDSAKLPLFEMEWI